MSMFLKVKAIFVNNSEDITLDEKVPPNTICTAFFFLLTRQCILSHIKCSSTYLTVLDQKYLFWNAHRLWLNFASRSDACFQFGKSLKKPTCCAT